MTAITEEEDCDDDEKNEYFVSQSKELAERIAKDLVDWLVTSTSNNNKNNGENKRRTFHEKSSFGERVVDEWKRWAKFGQELTLRDQPGDEKVTTVDIQYDGQLRVKDSRGVERLLIADYLL